MKSNQTFGIIIIVVGITVLFSQFITGVGFWQIIGLLWPLVLIGLSLYNIYTTKKVVFNNLALILVGLLFLAYNLEILPWGFWNTFWPLVLILFGASLLFSKGKDTKRNSIPDRNAININNIFGGTKDVINTNDFRGGSISCLFGGVEIDLRDAGISEFEANIDINCIFGGVKIYVPREWEVSTAGTPVFGDLKNQTHKRIVREEDEDNLIKPKLNTNYFVVFGGIEIRS